MIIKNLKNKKGFTLIELMVPTTLFTVIMLMGIGSLITSSNSAKSAQKLRTAVDNVNFAMESMTRELRTGTYYYCGNSVNLLDTLSTSDCDNGGNVIGFTPQKVTDSADRVAYRIRNNSGVSSLERCENKNSTVSCADIVSSDINIDTLKFYVNGTDINDNEQPSVRILIKGVASLKGVLTPFILQTMASQRSSEK